jgi:hypothetical protein
MFKALWVFRIEVSNTVNSPSMEGAYRLARRVKIHWLCKFCTLYLIRKCLCASALYMSLHAIPIIAGSNILIQSGPPWEPQGTLKMLYNLVALT